MSAADILAANGILRAAEVVELAAAARLELACAAVLLIKESGGGNNVWGHDNVSTDGCYDKGGVVTQANYTAYRAAVAQGRAGRQGCGPTQLTYGPYQDRADRAGGCWDWRANVSTGFGILAALIDQYGERDGFRRYNGAGAGAEHYADDAMGALGQWRTLLGSTHQEDTMPTAEEVADLVWRVKLRNAFGDDVEAQQILNGIEQRLADIRDLVERIVAKTGA